MLLASLPLAPRVAWKFLLLAVLPAHLLVQLQTGVSFATSLRVGTHLPQHGGDACQHGRKRPSPLTEIRLCRGGHNATAEETDEQN
jgi:hypothetical protein